MSALIQSTTTGAPDHDQETQDPAPQREGAIQAAEEMTAKHRSAWVAIGLLALILWASQPPRRRYATVTVGDPETNEVLATSEGWVSY
jgi:hypothetical protein